MERNVTLTLEKAKEWYSKGGELKEVALQAFKEDELKDIDYNYICKKLFGSRNYKGCYTLSGYSTEYTNYLDTPENRRFYHLGSINKLFAINKLVNTAIFLNEGWYPNWDDQNEIKYYIYYNNIKNDFDIGFCSYAQPIGVFFRTKELAERAIDILGYDCVKLAVAENW